MKVCGWYAIPGVAWALLDKRDAYLYPEAWDHHRGMSVGGDRLAGKYEYKGLWVKALSPRNVY